MTERGERGGSHQKGDARPTGKVVMTFCGKQLGCFERNVRAFEKDVVGKEELPERILTL